MNCNPTLLQQSLDDQLTEADEELLSAHLSQCEACQRELEKLAGRPAAWTRVGATLKAARESGESERSGIGFVRVVESDSAADFAVECLDPSTSAEYIGRRGDIEIQEVIGPIHLRAGMRVKNRCHHSAAISTRGKRMLRCSGRTFRLDKASGWASALRVVLS